MTAAGPKAGNGDACCQTAAVLTSLGGILSEGFNDRDMTQAHGKPEHPQTQGKIERWPDTLENRSSRHHFRRDLTILNQRQKIKLETLEHRRLKFQKQAT